MTQENEIRQELREMVLRQVEEINSAVGGAMLYVSEWAGLFALYGRPSSCERDRLMMCVVADVDGLARLWLRLAKGMEVRV